MRKLICVIFVSLFVIMSGCGSNKSNSPPDGMSERVYELGCAALETTDEFIAGNLDASSARTKLASAKRSIDSAVSKEKEDNGGNLVGSDVWKDDMVSHYILMIDTDIMNKEIGTGTLSAVKDSREDLAGTLGK